MQFKSITNIDLNEQIVFVRTDMNVPLNNGIIADDTRIVAGLKTLIYALDHGARVIVATHLGRPLEGSCGTNDSVLPIAVKLSQLLGYEVPVIKDYSQGINWNNYKIVMLENVRCNLGERANDDRLGRTYASLCDIFIHDAFATAHRKEASTDAIGHYSKMVAAGLLMSAELEALSLGMANCKPPLMAIIGGSKVSTKLALLENIASKVDYLVLGGGILNTFLAASGCHVGASLYEPELISAAKRIMQFMHDHNKQLPLPLEVLVAKNFAKDASAMRKLVAKLDNDDMILDIAPSFANELVELINGVNTVIWNGPLGVFEFEHFAQGSKVVAQAIANRTINHGLFSLAGGGDTIAAINLFGLHNKISYVSTAGGALLEFLEGKQLPGLALLQKYA